MRSRCLKFSVLAALLLAGVAPALAQNSEAQWLAVLKSDAPRKEKADACRELARVATKESVPTLAALLPDPEWNHMARYALETVPDPSADAALLAAVGQVKGLPLVGVIGSLGVRKSPGADQPLAGLLMDADPQVVDAAARALGNLATPAAIRALQAAVTKVPASQQLAVFEGLFRAAEQLVTQGQAPAATAIYDQLRPLAGAPHQVRAGALRGAILARGEAGLPLLVEALRGEDFILVDAAIRTALELPGTAVIASLAGELPKLSTDKQILVIQTLAWRKDQAALPALAAAANAGDLTVRIAAVRALTQIGTPAVAPLLVALLGNPERTIAQAAQDGLTSLPGVEADAAVIALLSHAEATQRLVALDILGKRKTPGALPALWTATTDTDGRVRAGALRRASELAELSDLPRLLDILAQTTAAADLSATALALGGLAERSGEAEAAVGTMALRLPKLQPAQQAALLTAMGAAGGTKALGIVRLAAKNPDPVVASAATETLMDWKTFDAAPDLLLLATTSTNTATVAAAFSACVRLCGETDVPAERRLVLLKGMAGIANSVDQKKRLLSALGEVPSLGALQLVSKYVADSALANEAGAAAVKICAKLDAASKADAAPVLNQVLKSAKAKSVLDGARKQMERLGIPPE